MVTLCPVKVIIIVLVSGVVTFSTTEEAPFTIDVRMLEL